MMLVKIPGARSLRAMNFMLPSMYIRVASYILEDGPVMDGYIDEIFATGQRISRNARSAVRFVRQKKPMKLMDIGKPMAINAYIYK